MSLQLTLMIIEKYVMAGLCKWRKVKCLNKTLYERYTQVVAKIEWVLSFGGWVHFCLLALITCLISKNGMSKLKVLLSNKTLFIQISGFNVEQHLCKFVHFFGTVRVLWLKSYPRLPINDLRGKVPCIINQN